MTTVTTVLPGYVAGTWDIDATHSDVSFSVRHMMVSKVRGRFNGVSGRLVTGDDLLDSSVTAEIDVTSFDTGNPQRDEHIRSADFLHATQFPTMTYRSSGLRWDGDQLMVDGELTLHGITLRWHARRLLRYREDQPQGLRHRHRTAARRRRCGHRRHRADLAGHRGRAAAFLITLWVVAPTGQPPTDIRVDGLSQLAVHSCAAAARLR